MPPITHLSFPQPAPATRLRSDRAREVARLFDLSLTVDRATPARRNTRPRLSTFLASPGQITLVTGPSGSGKSSLLRRFRRVRNRRWIDVASIDLPDRPTVDCFADDVSLPDALKLLSRAGLGEAWTYLRTPRELSEGQRWRLRLALALESARCASAPAGATPDRPIIVCDEFAAVLDRVTAAVIARMLRRAVTSDSSASAVVATSHDDLIPALQPDLILTCDFGTVHVRHASPRAAGATVSGAT